MSPSTQDQVNSLRIENHYLYGKLSRVETEFASLRSDYKNDMTKLMKDYKHDIAELKAENMNLKKRMVETEEQMHHMHH